MARRGTLAERPVVGFGGAGYASADEASCPILTRCLGSTLPTQDRQEMNGLARKIITVLWFPMFVVAARYTPFDHLPSTCVFVHVTGYPCASCGMTRAVMAIASGNWRRAAIMNPMAYPLMGLLAIVWLLLIHDVTTSRRPVFGKWLSRKATTIILLSFLTLMVFGVIRIIILTHNR